MSGPGQTSGSWGETLVLDWLESRGWEVLARNYRTRQGEIDLIACDGEYLAFVEVKFRRNTGIIRAREAVTAAKQRRIRQAALAYLAARPDLAQLLQPRFDVAEVYAPQGMETPSPRINYIENAFW